MLVILVLVKLWKLKGAYGSSCLGISPRKWPSIGLLVLSESHALASDATTISMILDNSGTVNCVVHIEAIHDASLGLITHSHSS